MNQASYLGVEAFYSITKSVSFTLLSSVITTLYFGNSPPDGDLNKLK